MLSTQKQQQQIIVKAYYNDLIEKQPEIRRFTIDISSDNDNYQTLETTISKLNTDYLELLSALNNISAGGVIKIFVKPKLNKSKESNQNTTIHVGVICDGCQGPVIGNRYKCLECRDYDLCQICSDKNLHSEHNMLKLTRPSQRLFGGHHRCGGRRESFGGNSRFWHHFMRQQCAPATFHVPFDINNFLNQFKCKELAELIEVHIPEYLRTEKINEMLNQFKTGEQADKPIDETILLENVGKILHEFLSSFGINCDYSVDKQTEEVKSKEKKEETTTNNNTSTEPKPTAPSATAASTSASTNLPPLDNLLEQLQTMFAPMFQSQTTTTDSAEDQQVKEQKKINECIERMISMGFVDSNGVLTELIKSKKGDLDQVLDALNPRNYKN
ncbi:unnamed protein product [Rotaria sordida]|uniref:ZZ-type domain-containing protein n=1 Tax=Rotaria sordida TaxID=392033 RepID=A0A815GHR4_9BILA|nr:unnamed protein product [Rotaria sordida]CAF1338591.1 unnamed protein product [Rotaria sordida]